MKKSMLLLFILTCVLIVTITTKAQVKTPPSTSPTRENILEDAVIDLLKPQMYSAIEDHYGTTEEISFMCERVIDIKKLDYPNKFEVKLEGITYTGPHNPLDTFTINISIDAKSEYKWYLKDYQVKKYKFKQNEKSPCRIGVEP